MPTLSKSFAVLALSSTALSAHAISFHVSTVNGTGMLLGGSLLATDETPAGPGAVGLVPFTTLSQSLSATVGSAVFEDYGTDSMVLAYAVTAFSVGAGGATCSGTWHYDSGTGAYAAFDPSASTGTFSSIFKGDAFGTVVSKIDGNLVGGVAPVPEPSGFAALALGAIGLLRRRMR